MHLAPQNDNRMSEHRILSLKPAFRLEWRGQNGQDEAEQSERDPQMLGDSFHQSMRIRFSVRTSGLARRMLRHYRLFRRSGSMIASTSISTSESG